MHSLVQKMDQTLWQRQWLKKDDLILVCVSGGSDSIALFHLLRTLQPQWQYRLRLLHFNHGLRPESLQEQQFVESLAAAYQIPCHVQVSSHLALLNASLQEQARQWRQEQSLRLLHEFNGQYIMTAHHADDQMETVLLKWLRGCHLSNLQGMAWQNGLTLRPLLEMTKAELREYLRQEQFQWMEDPSNQSPEYLRNRIRHELIPLMNELARDALPQRISDLTEQSGQLHEWMTQVLQNRDMDQPQGEFPELEIEELQRMPRFLLHSMLHQLIMRHTGKALDYQQFLRMGTLLKQPVQSWEIHLSPTEQLARRGKVLLIEKRQEKISDQCHFDDIEILVPRHWEVHAQRWSGSLPFPEQGVILFNIPLGSSLALRTRQDGDRFQPHWKRKPVKLKDFLRDQSIPLHQRNQIPLLFMNHEMIAVYPRFLSASVSQNQQTYPPLHLVIHNS